jgi:hypothetical protein
MTMPRSIILVLAAGTLACSSDQKSHNIGESCNSPTACGAQLFCYLDDATPGVCSTGCGDGQSCAQGACAPIVTSLGDSLCLQQCGAGSGCAPGFVCCAALGNVCTPQTRCTGPVPVNTGSSLSCAPRTVVNGGTIGPPVQPSSCQKPVVGVSLPNAHVQTFGPQTVGTSIAFNVPPGTGTISILQQVVDGGAPDTFTLPQPVGPVANAVVPFKVLGPGGGVFYDDDAPLPADLSRLEVILGAPEPATAAMTLPNTTQGLSHQASGYPAGQWSLLVNDFAFECFNHDPTVAGCTGGQSGQQYDIQIVTKPVAGSTGTVDLGLYLMTQQWTAASAVADADGSWTRFLDTLAGLYAKAGLCLGKVTFYSPPAWARTAYSQSITASDLTPCGNLDQMLTLSQPGGAVPVFFVDRIRASTPTGTISIVGIDGAIPGPAGAGGTVHSGALVNVSNLTTAGCGATPAYLTCGSDNVAYIAAHEGGHFLGLFHTTEQDGSLSDPLDDTPQCAATCDVSPPDGLVFPNECSDDSSNTTSCGGADYLMFWLISDRSLGTLSAQQSSVMRANPAVH